MNHDSQKSIEAADPLDALLRDSDAHVPDNGFTSRVLVSLPPRCRFDRGRLMLFASAWVAGVAILLLRAPAVHVPLTVFFEHARHGDLSSLPAWVPIVAVFGCLVWALVTWAIEEWA